MAIKSPRELRVQAFILSLTLLKKKYVTKNTLSLLAVSKHCIDK